MLFLDTEFNGWSGKLISLALVHSDFEDVEWYGVLPLPDKINPWVRENVIPVLNAEPMEPNEFLSSLRLFLALYPGETIVADWPADLAHFMHCLYDTQGFGYWGKSGMGFRLINRTAPLFPEIPHNALSDARALKSYWIEGWTNDRYV
jgi:hypothetical protein